MDDLWYTTPEIVNMRERTGALVREVADHEDSWSATLAQLYQNICNDENREDNSQPDTIFNAPIECVLERRGIEGGAVLSIGRDAAFRRRQIREIVAEYQQAPISDDDIRQALIRQGSVDLSRPARVFARHVAAMAVVETVSKESK